MPAAHPLIEDMPGEVPSTFSVGVTGEANALGAEARAGGTAGVGMSEESGYQTHLWVAGVIFFALAAIVLLQISGFRFATDVGITRG